MFMVATDDEVPAIAALMNRAFRKSDIPSAWSTEAWSIAQDRTSPALLRAEIAEKPNAALLRWEDAQTSETILGCVWLEPIGGGTWYLGTLAIEPASQNSGLGRTMLAAAEQWIAAHGGQRVRMRVVNVREALIAWYVRRGYHLTGETEPFPFDNDLFGIAPRDDVHFVILERAVPAAA